MGRDDYRYIKGKASRYPIWGTEIAYREMSRSITLTITTARFDPSESEPTGMLAAMRSVWSINDTDQKARVESISRWTAEVPHWNEKLGIPRGLGAYPIPQRHRELIASILMSRWEMGKLRGRIRED